ncbi:MAG: dihydroorotase [Gammaproteobacteria bacterium]
MRRRISNGRIIDPANGIDALGDICIDDDHIVSVLKSPADFSPDQEINAVGMLVCPGFVDLCARLREPGQEQKANIASESLAAAGAGITTICCPPDTQPVIDTSAVVELIHQRAEAINKTRIYPLGALTHALEGQRLADMHTLKRAGCAGVSNANRPVENTEVLRRAMEYAASFDITLFLHPEDHYLRNHGVVHEGPVSTRLGLPPIPSTAETIAISRALLLMEQTGVKVHFCRISSRRSVSMIAEARQAGLPVSADVGICYLRLSEENVDNYNTNCHMIPPLRARSDMQALREGVEEGVIDAVCSDHQPHDDDAKSAPFSETEPGASTLDLLFPLLNELVNDDALSLNHAIAVLTVNPARILGLELGTLSIGADADITIINPGKKWQVDKANLLSAGKNTPFDGWELTGKVTHTLLRGRIVYAEG